jgi:hypothetical protein
LSKVLDSVHLGSSLLNDVRWSFLVEKLSTLLFTISACPTKMSSGDRLPTPNEWRIEPATTLIRKLGCGELCGILGDEAIRRRGLTTLQ